MYIHDVGLFGWLLARVCYILRECFKMRIFPQCFVVGMLLVWCLIARADEVKDRSELLRLPEYCWGARQITAISHDPRPIEEYIRIYGQTYSHFHHYCWALNSENNAVRIKDKFLRESKLGYALADIQYVLDRAAKDFIFLPEVYFGQARILFLLRREVEAVTALKNAISVKSDYVLAYARLSDYFLNKDNKSEAIKILKDGIDNSDRPGMLIKKLKKLGVTYDGKTPKKLEDGLHEEDGGKTKNAIPAEKVSEGAASVSTPPFATNSDKEDELAPRGEYCRFCP